MSLNRSSSDSPSDHVLAVDVEDIEIFESQSHSDSLLTGHYQASNSPLQGLTIKEACAFYKVSESTMRGRLKRGEVSATKVKTPTGEQWRIFPEGSLTGHYQSINSLVTTPTSPTPDNGLIALLDRKTERLEAAMLEIGSLQAQLQATREQMKLLEDRSKRPWWRRLWESLKS